jgi:transcriptional regulator with GAF, ATPase, and Fis domain
LVDAELFGHVRGSFTGAVGDRPGAFELADRGTLFLDEIAELSPTGQAKLLRVVEDKVVRPIGAKESQIVDARIVAATCIDLPSRVRRGEFRLDLYHRLGALVLEVPPLRRRTGDIPLLVKAFLQSKRAELGERVVEPRALRLLMEHPWSGNVRELFAQLYRAALHAPSAVLTVGDFSLGPKREGLKTREQAEELIREMGSVAAAARYAGVPRTTFRDILRTPSSAKTDDDALEDPR